MAACSTSSASFAVSTLPMAAPQSLLLPGSVGSRGSGAMTSIGCVALPCCCCCCGRCLLLLLLLLNRYCSPGSWCCCCWEEEDVLPLLAEEGGIWLFGDAVSKARGLQPVPRE